MVKKLIKQIKWIFTPSYWIMNNPYDPVWDSILNDLLDKHRFTKITRYTADLGPAHIWVSNHPYASMVLYPEGRGGRPSRDTIKRAWNRLQEDRAEVLKVQFLWRTSDE